MADKNRVEVRIAGKDYRLVGTESEEYIQRVSLFVDKKMTEIMRRNHRLSTSMAAVLTAINVADDYFKIRESEHALKEKIREAEESIQRLTEENQRIIRERDSLLEKNTQLQLELATREAELREVRSSLEKYSRSGGSYR